MSAARDLNALLGSRICHDLISPLGAIGNGVELLSMTGGTPAPEIALISDSVENANARIRFYRVAFGVASRSQSLGASECRKLLRDVYGKTRLSIAWQNDGDRPRAEVKLVLLLVLCFETAMPWGGRLSIRAEDGRYTLEGSAERTNHDEALWALLAGGKHGAELSSANVHFALAPQAAAGLGRAIEAKRDANVITVTC